VPATADAETFEEDALAGRPDETLLDPSEHRGEVQRVTLRGKSAASAKERDALRRCRSSPGSLECVSAESTGRARYSLPLHPRVQKED
jgi:hypothetical protein